MKRLTWFASVLAAVGYLGCSSDDPGAQIAFHGEAPAVPGFSYDTGLIPASGPAQVSLKLVAGGNVSVDAKGTAAGSKIAGVGGSGKLALDLHLKLEGTLKVASTLKNYDGPIPGLANIDVPIVGSTAFDPFLLDGQAASLPVAIPETKLPDIPLGGVPGSLRLTVVSGSQVQVKFGGRCMSVAGGAATYAGDTTISGSLVMKGEIALTLPAPLNKSIELAQFTVPIPEGTRALPFAAVSSPGVSDGQEGGGCGGATGDGGTADDGSTTSDGGTAGDGGKPPSNNHATVKINGVDEAVTGFTSFASGSGVVLVIKLARPGATTDLVINANRRGTGCEVGGNLVTYRPDGDYQLFATSATCGLNIAVLPSKPGERFAGTFLGAVGAVNGSSAYRQMDVTFDVELGRL